MNRKVRLFKIFLAAALAFNLGRAGAQNPKAPVYVDKNGTLRWAHSKKEAQFFGVNYTVPFAYGYRSHRALGIDPERAIDADVAHMARLGFDAFRVHVWDTEIADSAGNLLENEHLRLFDYLVHQLKVRGIKILITPLAFWGSGYPEPDPATGSFSNIWNKQKVLVTEAAIKAQEAYLQQFFRHVNPYTKKTYGADEDVIAMEINNEPHHSGPQQGATDYINRMVAAVRSTGWNKPIFYNISESPTYAGAVVKARVDGHSFQWYPTGLVANHTLQGNYLPHVDRYAIPFSDSLPLFPKRARMVYEFDAGDVLGSYMYPAMARSFRTAGFQWATQFAYDPLHTAHANTEYQTHYLNLAYTPSKALSLMIAGKVFRQVPRFKNFGTFPADTLFGPFRVSYKEDLGEMNTAQEFIYSNTTATKPVNAAALKLVAGVGSSPVVQYRGTGAYFLDKLAPGVWRLEVFPDVFQLSDPFSKASPRKTVRRLLASERTMTVQLPDLDLDFEVATNRAAQQVQDGSFVVKPGVYLLKRKGATYNKPLEEEKFSIAAPALSPDSVLLTHTPAIFAAAEGPLHIAAQVAGADTVRLELRHGTAGWRTVNLQPGAGFLFSAPVPIELMTPGPLEYRLLAKSKSGRWYAFPGGVEGEPYAWDALPAQTWKTTILPQQAQMVLFDAATDATALSVYTPSWEQNKIQYSAGAQYPYTTQVLSATNFEKAPLLAWQLFIGGKIGERAAAVPFFKKITVRATGPAGARLHLVLATAEGQAYAADVVLQDGREEYEVPLSGFAPAQMLLLPRPYPHFQPLAFGAAGLPVPQIKNLEILQVGLQASTGTAGTIKATLQNISLE